MKENIEVYNKEWELVRIEERSAFYLQAKETFLKWNEIHEKVQIVSLIMMNSSWRIYLQKRSRDKEQNGWKYDKTISWHVTAWDSNEITLIRECAEELGFPAAVVRWIDFKKAISSTNLWVIGLFKRIDLLEDFISTRSFWDIKDYKQPFIIDFYVGYYDGPIHFIDWESSGIEVFSVNELEEEIKASPESFTQDIQFLFTEYKHLFTPISKN